MRLCTSGSIRDGRRPRKAGFWVYPETGVTREWAVGADAAGSGMAGDGRSRHVAAGQQRITILDLCNAAKLPKQVSLLDPQNDNGTSHQPLYMSSGTDILLSEHLITRPGGYALRASPPGRDKAPFDKTYRGFWRFALFDAPPRRDNAAATSESVTSFAALQNSAACRSNLSRTPPQRYDLTRTKPTQTMPKLAAHGQQGALTPSMCARHGRMSTANNGTSFTLRMARRWRLLLITTMARCGRWRWLRAQRHEDPRVRKSMASRRKPRRCACRVPATRRRDRRSQHALYRLRAKGVRPMH
jgi:hypothetical protein